MSRKPKHIPVSLHPLPIDQLPEEDIRTILRGADDLQIYGLLIRRPTGLILLRR